MGDHEVPVGPARLDVDERRPGELASHDPPNEPVDAPPGSLVEYGEATVIYFLRFPFCFDTTEYPGKKRLSLATSRTASSCSS